MEPLRPPPGYSESILTVHPVSVPTDSPVSFRTTTGPLSPLPVRVRRCTVEVRNSRLYVVTEVTPVLTLWSIMNSEEIHETQNPGRSGPLPLREGRKKGSV